MSRSALLAGGLLAAGALAGCGTTTTVTVTRTVTTTRTVTASTPSGNASACTGTELSGVFTEVPGSAGAGQISYALTVTNTGHSPCFVSGVPAVQLLDAGGKELPTHATAARPGVTAARIVLAPRAAARAQARFSPDVAGTGDAQTGACQPQASTLRVTPNGGGSLDAPIRPPTSVCEQGGLQFEPYASVS